MELEDPMEVYTRCLTNPTREVPLHPELEKYNEGDKIRHPLVYAVPYFPLMAEYYNAMYIHKKECLEKYKTSENWTGCIWLHERPYRLEAFIDIEQHLSDEEYWEILGDVYTDSENIHQNIFEWSAYLESTRPHRECFMSEEDREVFNGLPEEITVYRGYNGPRAAAFGLSYTMDEDKATWFANRFSKGKGGVVITRVIRKADVIAYMSGRGECEIVIHPRAIKG